jgi:hypothetical protein
MRRTRPPLLVSRAPYDYIRLPFLMVVKFFLMVFSGRHGQGYLASGGGGGYYLWRNYPFLLMFAASMVFSTLPSLFIPVLMASSSRLE